MTDAHDNAASQASLGRLLVFTIPLLWAVLVLFHPNPGEGGPFEAIRDDVNRWLIVHVGQLVLTPLLVFAVWRLVEGIPSAAAKVSRAAVIVWAAFFTAYDSIQGISTGVLIRYTEGLAGDQQAGVARALDYLVSDSQLAGNVSAIGLIASAAWLTVAIAAAVALHKAGAGKWVVIAALLSVVFVAHSAPAAFGLAALAVAGVMRERQRARPETPRARAALGSP